MAKEKNTFSVFRPVFILISIMTILSVTIFILFFITYRNESVTPSVFVVGLIMLLISPISLWLWSFLYLAPKVEINDKGIIRTLLFIRKYLSWDDCKEIAMINTPTQGWLFFSESEVIVKGSGFWALSKYRLKRDNIFLASNKKVLAIVNKYAPDSLLPIDYKNNKYYAGND